MKAWTDGSVSQNRHIGYAAVLENAGSIKRHPVISGNGIRTRKPGGAHVAELLAMRLAIQHGATVVYNDNIEVVNAVNGNGVTLGQRRWERQVPGAVAWLRELQTARKAGCEFIWARRRSCRSMKRADYFAKVAARHH